MMVEELWAAARKGFFERVELLVAHGTDVSTPGVRDGRTPYEAALMTGNDEIAQYLVAHGARQKLRRRPRSPSRRRRWPAGAMRRGRCWPRIRSYWRRSDPRAASSSCTGAVEADRREGLRLLAALGFELSGTTVHQGVGMYRAVTPLHNAAWAGTSRWSGCSSSWARMCRPVTRPITRRRWAGPCTIGSAASVEYLMPFATVFDAVQADGVERVAELLARDPTLPNAVDDDGSPLLFYLPGLPRAEETIDVLRAHGADLDARDRKGRTVVDEMRRRGRDELARALRDRGAKTAPERAG